MSPNISKQVDVVVEHFKVLTESFKKYVKHSIFSFYKLLETVAVVKKTGGTGDKGDRLDLCLV